MTVSLPNDSVVRDAKQKAVRRRVARARDQEVGAKLAFRGESFANVLQIADNKKGPTFR